MQEFSNRFEGLDPYAGEAWVEDPDHQLRPSNLPPTGWGVDKSGVGAQRSGRPTIMQTIHDRTGSRPVTPEELREFEAEYGPFASDGEG